MLNYNPDTQMIKMIAKDTGDFVITLDNYLLADGFILRSIENWKKRIPLLRKLFLLLMTIMR